MSPPHLTRGSDPPWGSEIIRRILATFRYEFTNEGLCSNCGISHWILLVHSPRWQISLEGVRWQISLDWLDKDHANQIFLSPLHRALGWYPSPYGTELIILRATLGDNFAPYLARTYTGPQPGKAICFLSHIELHLKVPCLWKGRLASQ